MAATDPYTLEQAETDIADLRGQVDRLGEVLTQSDGALTPNAPPAGDYTQSAAGGQMTYISGTDGNTYRTGRCRQRIAPGNHNQGVTSTTPASVPDLAFAVAAATYQVRGRLVMTCGASAGAMNLRITGPAISEGELFCQWKQVNTNSLVTNQTDGSNQAGLTGSGSGYNSGAMSSPPMPAAGAVYTAMLDCAFTFTAAGTLQMQAAEDTGGDAWTLNYGYWELSPG